MRSAFAQFVVDKRNELVRAVAAMAIAGAVGPANAAVIWDYSPDTLGASGTDNFTNVESSQNFADRFTIGSSFTITGVDIYSTLFFGSEGQSVTINLYNDGAAGVPGTLINEYVSTISVIDDVGSMTVSSNRKHADVAPINLNAGTYWIGMAGTMSTISQQGLSVGGVPDDGMMALFDADVFSGMRTFGDMAFRLHGTVNVPEPSALALLALGLAGLGFSRRKRVVN